MKILSASVKVIDDKNHIRILSLAEVNITIKGPRPSPIEKIPEIQEAPKLVESHEPKKNFGKKKQKKQ
jgi:hypothetical protein